MSGPIACRTSHDLPATPWSCSGVNFPAPGISRSMTNFGIAPPLDEGDHCGKTAGHDQARTRLFFRSGGISGHTRLDDSYHIGRIRVNPTNPDLVYVAAMGHAFGPNDMRGVYRSKDGGKSWEKILFVTRDAGAVDLAMDPTNPRILYATTWRFRRGPYFFESGGEGSALWKSTDGGDTWKELSRNKGMPKGPLAIIGLSVSPTNPQNIYAIVEAKDGGEIGRASCRERGEVQERGGGVRRSIRHG